jgi:hypothetical protein
MTGDRKPMVQIASLWERTSKAGNVYYSGFMGSAQLLMFRGEEITRDNGDVVQTWNLLVQERDQAPRQKKNSHDEKSFQAQTRQRHVDQGRARAAGEAVLREARQPRTPEPPAGWLDDHEQAVADLERGR